MLSGNPAMAQADTIPTTDMIWSWLKAVPDPEIPVLSILDLGIVRNVHWRGETLVVTVTPTYSGCPATATISLDIETALRDQGLTELAVEQQLSPAWTTDWISEDGRRKLRDYGIAPPQASAEKVPCPRCGSTETERVSAFGSTPCKAAWRCTDCLEPFDYFKCH